MLAPLVQICPPPKKFLLTLPPRDIRRKCKLSLYAISRKNASYHCMQFQGKLMNQTRENDLKSSLEPDFGPFWPPKYFSLALPLLDVIYC